MTQVLMGKVLPNLKITLDDSNAEENIEEGEITDDESEVEHFISSEKEKPQSIEIVRTWMKTLPNPKVYENKNGAFITGIDLSSEVVVKKLEERAARFGLERNEERQITQDEINALYSSMDIDIENRNSNKIMNIRLNAIHMRGVNEMNTSEIFQYFSDYGASTVEWINDYSCNVVWVDDTSAARALLGMSRVLSIKRKKDENDMKFDLKNDEKDSKDSKENEAIILMSESEESDSEESVHSSSKSEKGDLPMDIDQKEDVVTRDSPSVDVPIPPGTWRLGMPHPKAKAILLRFATKDDRKLPGAEKRSQFYQKYGNPNYGGLRGLISTSRKRKIQAAKNREVIGKFSQETNYQDEIHAFIQDRPAAPRSGRLKQPRMKMYADEEEEKKIKRKKQVAEYSSDGKKNIFSRLGTKYTKEDLYHLGRKFSDNEENESDKKEERKVTSRFSIWNDIAKSMADEENYSPRDEVKSKEPTRDLRNNLDGSASRKRTHSPPRYHDKFSSRISSHSSFSDRRVKSSFSDRKMKSSFSDRRTNSSSDRRRDSSSDRRMNSSSDRRRDSSSDRRTYSSKFQGDLRSKIKKLKRDDSESASKHRSPLCKDD
ncbi:nuclear cap-binding protein subunit 3-like [Uloborus diversus]|uniref:nuclear cap-binding protein subunit 3-like n=1 Tax=Uloborus diversus TaxID=327109 RepID=UPI00240A50C4|nr:nuclear cap-binding protein subunit 3-like [Uloborus diversus]